MQQADMNPDDFTNHGQSEADKKLLVRFFTKSVKDDSASSEAGRPIFKDREYLDIRVPGSRDNVVRRATARDKQRFSPHYRAYRDRTEAPIEGTPLVEWSMINRSLAEELGFFNIRTVEQLADLNDNLAGQFVGIQNFKRKAKDWLEACREEGVLSAMRDELELRDAQLKSQEDQINKLVSRLEHLEAK